MTVLKDKVAIITGASSGIGAATAECFASLGCNLILTGRNEKNLNVVKVKCLAAGLKDSQILVVKADVTDSERMKYLVDEAIKKFSKLDILVNSAGVVAFAHISSSPIDVYDNMMNINVRAVIMLIKLCLPHLEKSKGSIVNVSSICGPCAFADVAYYCMSKSAVDQMTKCLALEMAPRGVRVNAVNPGLIITELHKRSGMNEQQYADFVEKSEKTHAMGRNGQPMEVAKAIAFLASDDCSFTTGQLFAVDGGRAIMTH